MKARAKITMAALITAASAVAAATAADGPKGARTANATCFTATAILLVGDGSDHERAWSMIRQVAQSNKRWTIVPEMQPNTVGTLALVQFDVKHQYKGGPTTAYAVQCGHGGTCNEVAVAFAAKHPTIQPPPFVQCGDVSHMLTNPTPR